MIRNSRIFLEAESLNKYELFSVINGEVNSYPQQY